MRNFKKQVVYDLRTGTKAEYQKFIAIGRGRTNNIAEHDSKNIAK